MFAATNSKTEILEIIFGFSPNLNARDSMGRTPLHLICSSGKIENFQLLVSKILEGEQRHLLFARSVGGITPLMSAINSGRPELVEQCLAIGMCPHTSDFLGNSCLVHAQKFDNDRQGYGSSIKEMI